MNLKNRIKIAAFFCIVFLFLSSTFLFAYELKGEVYNAKIKDISDRAYEPAVVELIDNAKVSIVMSMYLLKPGGKEPIRNLIKDLEGALDRGVGVEIYLNTRQDSSAPPNNIMDEAIQSLIKKGAKIYKFTPHYRLHDKLIIVDERFVVDGSMNWTVTAIKENYESAILVDSPELAKAKLTRLRRFPLEGDKRNYRPDRSESLVPLADEAIVEVSKILLNNKNYFPAMLKRHAGRTMDTYLILMGEAARVEEKEFFVPLEELALKLGMSDKWSDTELRRQAIRELKSLQDRYKLVEVDFSYGKDAWVRLVELAGETFGVKGYFFGAKYLVSKSESGKFVYLVREMLISEGTKIEDFSRVSLAERFGISEFSIRKGLKQSIDDGL